MISMEEPWTSWLCDLEADDYSFINESDKNVVDGSFPTRHDMAAAGAAVQEENPQRSLSSDSHCSHATFNTCDESSLESPAKLLKVSSSNSANTEHLSQKPVSSPCSFTLSFEDVNPPSMKVGSALDPKNKAGNHGRSLPSKGSSENLKNYEPSSNFQEGKKTGSVVRPRSPHHARDHIVAERMRREKITQQFIALSALIPGLKKMDKVSVLGDAIKYVKQLQEQLKLMEEQTKRKSAELVVFVKRSQLSADEYVSDTSSDSCDGNSDDPSKRNHSLPEVEARMSEKKVLIRIHCEEQKGVLMNILREIEKLHLSVINSSALLFGNSVLDITIIAEMDDEFGLSVKDLARNLRVGLLKFMQRTGVW